MRIAITGGKGGTGKSMVATSLAVLYAKNNKTLLIDADAECPNDHLLLGVRLKKVSAVNQMIPKWNLKKCVKCGKCALACQKKAIVFVQDKYPAFVSDVCIGCKACILSCPFGAISEKKKEIGKIYNGQNYNVNLIVGELKLGELASGEVVAELRKYAEKVNEQIKADIILIDSAAGVGCPVIASLVGTDYIVAVTEPTPSALHDLKRVLYLANHFKIKHGIVINKYDLSKKFALKIEKFAQENEIPVIGQIPYRQDFVNSTIQMKPVIEVNKDYQEIFSHIIEQIK
ncbi:MAG: ATP-binding protein [Minisyncoccus archaeiphilus]|uniref:nucleotide-binding protein n=1 Tax=Minisyncoccus archaeiphilus TaxID=3238481 RepID=UPI002B1128B0|nr:MAG: ATP-binding protein [Candidatus Parcubacteria bacterium]